MRGKAPLYARVSGPVIEELRARAEANGLTLSAETADTIERGLGIRDPQALHGLLGWCWQIAGYLRGGGDATGERFAEAIAGYEIELGIRAPYPVEPKPDGEV